MNLSNFRGLWNRSCRYAVAHDQRNEERATDFPERLHIINNIIKPGYANLVAEHLEDRHDRHRHRG